MIITFTSIACFVLAETFEAFEMIYETTRRYEAWAVDELFVVGVILAFAFALFSYLRWRELEVELERRIQTQIELDKACYELDKAYSELKESIEQRQMLEELKRTEDNVVRRKEAQFSAVLAERTRMARELHDTLAQGFAGVAFQLEGVATKLFEAPQEAHQHLDLALSMVRYSLDEARRSIWDLRPQALESGSLALALSEFAQQLTSDVPVEVEVTGIPTPLSEETENNLLRISQESLLNAIRHAQATQIHLTLHFDSRYVRLCVRDNGRGFDVQAPSSAYGGHFGLLGMHERAKQISGQLRLQSAQGEGTEVEVTVPLKFGLDL